MDPYAPRTNPGPRADVRSRLPIRPTDDKYTSLTEVTAWLRERGVSKRKARDFLQRSGAVTVDNLALYLRFQLPPLQFANIDCVNRDMWYLLGVTGKAARRIIVDLDILSAIPILTSPSFRLFLPAVRDTDPVGRCCGAAHRTLFGYVFRDTVGSPPACMLRACRPGDEAADFSRVLRGCGAVQTPSTWTPMRRRTPISVLQEHCLSTPCLGGVHTRLARTPSLARGT